MERERRVVGSEYLRYFREFSEVTTLHGVRYLVERGRSLLERLFWTLALVTAVCTCALFVRQVSLQYHSNPVVTTVSSQPTPSSTFPAPAVTVCSTTHSPLRYS